MTNQTKPIVFFDGMCNLCNGYVDFLLNIGGGKKLNIASLQGETAKQLLPTSIRDNLHSVVFYVNGQSLEKSAAIFAIAARLGFPWKALLLFRVLPLGLCNRVYDFVAKHRYQWFGERSQCRLPTPEEKTVFLP